MSGYVPVLPTLGQRLADAQVQYHKLVTGQGAVQITDRNGETVRYSLADRVALEAYINVLKYMITNNIDDNAAPTPRTPVRFVF